MRWSKEINTAIIILIIHSSAEKSNKNTAPAVFEVINEQARMDEKRVLPYANPLAGNSQQKAKIHAQHQQAMFNAEKIRQHRAQLQRWNQQPTRQQVDSYMKAYQESQENHHLALERMQSNSKDKKIKVKPERQLKEKPEIEPIKITRADAIDKNRNHRSYGSIYTAAEKKRTINTYPGATYNQGVTIKPNGNVGLHNLEKERRSLYTEAVPSKTQYIYPKLFSQMHEYHSENDINALNTQLNKSPQEQLTQPNSLIHTTEDLDQESLNKPIDLYFYVNDPHAVNAEPTQTVLLQPHTAEFINNNDHKPIKEEVDDIPDLRDHRIRTYFKSTAPTVVAQIEDDTKATKDNYYKIEVDQTLVGNLPQNIEYIPQEKPHHVASMYKKPVNVYVPGPSTEGVKYLQSQPTVVQHLNQDGTGVSAYGDDDIHYAANYEFGYRVHDHETGNDFGHQELKSGENTRGQYHVLLPDGRMQQVKYSAGPGGYHADISYDHLQDSI